MPTKLTFVFIVSILLFTFSKARFPHAKPPDFLANKHRSVIEALSYEGGEVAIWTSLITGVTAYLPKEEKAVLKSLYLSHLVTPSGVHFSAILIAINFLLSALKGRWAYIKTGLNILVILTPFTLSTGFEAMKRSSLYSVFSKIPLVKIWGITPLTLFYFTFGLDFLFGTYKVSPGSFNYSFIFLGTIFATLFQGGKKLFVSLMLSQMVASAFSGGEFNLLGFFFGFKLTLLFTVLFPILFVLYWIPYAPILMLGKYIIIQYVDLCRYGAKIADHFPSIYCSMLTVMMALLLTLKFKRSYKIALLVFILTLSPVVVDQIPKEKRIALPIYNFGEIRRMKYLKNGLYTQYENGIVCKYGIKESRYSKRCQWKITPKQRKKIIKK